MCINIPLNYILIFGKLGFPALGIRGAAIGTIAGSATIFLILLTAYLHHQYYRDYDRVGRWEQIKVIEEEELLPEIHQPEIKTEAKWM